MMGSYVDIVIFAVIAVFIILRLKSTLGTRNGTERQRPNPFTIQVQDVKPPVIDVPPTASRGQIVDQLISDDPAQPISVAGGLTQIKLANPSFDDKAFLNGARVALQRILTAFAAGDEATLSTLLAPEMMKTFSAAIAERKSKGETLETQLLRIKDTDIIAARVNAERQAFITVHFVSDQINVIRSAAGHVLEGNPDRGDEINDRWVFRRDTTSSDPNWLLVATGAPG